MQRARQPSSSCLYCPSIKAFAKSSESFLLYFWVYFLKISTLLADLLVLSFLHPQAVRTPADNSIECLVGYI